MWEKKGERKKRCRRWRISGRQRALKEDEEEDHMGKEMEDTEETQENKEDNTTLVRLRVAQGGSG